MKQAAGSNNLLPVLLSSYTTDHRDLLKVKPSLFPTICFPQTLFQTLQQQQAYNTKT
jgi:hypothetical protein